MVCSKIYCFRGVLCKLSWDAFMYHIWTRGNFKAMLIILTLQKKKRPINDIIGLTIDLTIKSGTTLFSSSLSGLVFKIMLLTLPLMIEWLFFFFFYCTQYFKCLITFLFKRINYIIGSYHLHHMLIWSQTF